RLRASSARPHTMSSGAPRRHSTRSAVNSALATDCRRPIRRATTPTRPGTSTPATRRPPAKIRPASGTNTVAASTHSAPATGATPETVERCRCKRFDPPVERGPDPSEGAEAEIVCGQPLDIAGDRTGECEEADKDDGDGQ